MLATCATIPAVLVLGKQISNYWDKAVKIVMTDLEIGSTSVAELKAGIRQISKFQRRHT